MKKNITIRGTTHKEADDSRAIRNYIDENLAKIGHLLDHVKDPVFIDITVDIAKPHPHHQFDFRLHGPHFEIIVKREGPELYLAIDVVIELICNHRPPPLLLASTMGGGQRVRAEPFWV